MTAAEPRINVTEKDGVKVIAFTDRKILDELAIAELGDELRNVVESQSGARVLLDFKNVEHLSSAALGMLITLDKLVKTQKGQLRLSNINSQIFEVFKITRLNKLFQIHESSDAALAAF
jgi:anti-sigma B factor antagonist